ncbi:MAG TPA: glycine cleavage system protein GcvH [Streptosporangiaceae bacterium]|jgi:glycine cleavage system H protein
MSNVPSDRGYTAEHEWITTADGVATIGVTEHAAEQLGDVVYVQLPDVGAKVTAGQPCGEIESTKSVSDLYSPVDGEVVEVNGEVNDDPGLVNTEPFGTGWLIKVRTDGEPEGLLTAEQYTELIA